MSFLKKGSPYRFPKGLRIQPMGDSKFRIEFSAGWVQTGCDFTLEEIEKIAAHFTDVLQMVKLTGFNYKPTKENVDIEDEESRA